MITYPLNNVEYSAEDAELFHCTRTSGVWAKDDFPFSVTGADNSITVGTGIAWINNDDFSGKVVASKETTVLDLGVPDSVYPRIDVVAIQFDANENETKLVVKKGTPASSPLIPAISRTASLYELYLCKIERPAGAPVVSALSVSDLRLDQQYCGLMADSVTSVNTEQINRQIDDFIEKLRDTIEDVQSDAGLMLENYWTEDGKIPVSRGGTGQENLTENSFVVGNGENSVKLLTPNEARESMGLGNSKGVLATVNGGTGHSSFNKGHFLVGSIYEPIDSLSPAKARESMGLGNSTGPLSVQNGGTGRSSFAANYFLRGNGTGNIFASSPNDTRESISAQKNIEIFQMWNTKSIELEPLSTVPFDSFMQTDNGDCFERLNQQVLRVKQDGLYAISAMFLTQLEDDQGSSSLSGFFILYKKEEGEDQQPLSYYSFTFDEKYQKISAAIPLFVATLKSGCRLYVGTYGGNTLSIFPDPLSHVTVMRLR